MPLYSDISGTETGKCTDCTKLRQTVALFETRLAALEKCKGLLQDTVPMGEFAELTQTNTQQDDQRYTVSFPKLDKREKVPAASHWHRVGAKPKQHTKVNQQVHSTPNAKLPKTKVACISRICPSLKLTLPLKNRFLPLQKSTNAPATHAPLSPEMRPDKQWGQRPTINPSPERRAVHASATRAPLSPEMCPDGRCGQRWNKNQSPRRRAAHASTTATTSQQGPISQKADEPDTLIIGDSTIKDITGKKIKTCYFPDVMATVRAQVEKKRDYSLPDTSTLPLSATQIADRPKTLKRDNSLPDTMDTVPSPIADAGLARNGHPPPLHSPIDDDLQPHLSHSHNNNSSSTVSSLSQLNLRNWNMLASNLHLCQ
ncbi:unnamed protein product [Boreogadus saida]